MVEIGLRCARVNNVEKVYIVVGCLVVEIDFEKLAYLTSKYNIFLCEIKIVEVGRVILVDLVNDFSLELCL
jgi:hypothetical protein